MHFTEPEAIDYTIYLLGDAGKPVPITDDALYHWLQNQLARAAPESALLYLGDNIYPVGLPPKGHKKRRHAERVARAQHAMTRDFDGQVYYISGNHDWNKGKRGGWHYAQRQQHFIEALHGRGEIYLPRNGCPGPVEVLLNEKLRMIFINTQWWVQRGFRPAGEAYGCCVDTGEEFFEQLDLLLEQSTRTTLIVAHHPVYSRAMHGGKFKWRHHLFPFQMIHSKLFIPVPVAGSLYPLYRKYYGHKEDMAHPRYKRLRKGLLQVLGRHRHVIYVSGHEHNLQYIFKNDNHFLISGSGSKTAYVKRGGSSVFASPKKGLMRLHFRKDQSIVLEAWRVDGKNPDGLCLYRGPLKGDIKYA